MEKQNLKKNVLGKGIGALLSSGMSSPISQKLETELLDNKRAQDNLIQGNPTIIDINMVKINPYQPRRVFKDKDLEDLTNSVKENGIIQPILVSFLEEENKFEIIAGERRFRAAKNAGLSKIPVIVKRVTKKDKLVMAIIENVQRSDLNCVEEALAYFQLMDEFNLTQEEVSKKVGKDRSTVANFLRILKMPKEIILMLQKEQLSFGHAKILASIENTDHAIRIANKAVSDNMSVRDLEKEVKTQQLQKKNPTTSADPGKDFFEQKVLALKQKLERKTGFHINIKTKAKNKGKIELNFNNEAEFNDIFTYLME